MLEGEGRQDNQAEPHLDLAAQLACDDVDSDELDEV